MVELVSVSEMLAYLADPSPRTYAAAILVTVIMQNNRRVVLGLVAGPSQPTENIEQL
jgi:hypothetical protein